MLNKKNFSPRQLSVLTALILSIPISLWIFFLKPAWQEAIISFAVIFSGSYFLILFIFQRFIYQTKASKKEEMYYKYILPQKSMDEVREDVEAWAEQRRKEIESLKKNETFRKEFLQNLSHEFKTPVFAIQGYVDTLLQGAMDNPEINKNFLEKAGKNVQRLANLIQDLDEISKLERGEISLNKQNFVIQDLVRDAFESLSLMADQQKISFGFKKGCEKSFMVHADKEKIRQVIMNLVENSVKYGKHGGHVVASIYNTDGENILVEISDDGMGISENNLNRIFERFYRGPEGRSRDVQGSGLGLAICKHIIEAHGHSIHVRSKTDVGTTIGFTLDARKEM
jgi:two-component system phosphate regulon sensor histidine kinase PhoR